MTTRATDRDLEELLQLIGPLKTPVQVRKIEIAKVNSDGTVSPQCPDFISKEQAYEDIDMLGYLLETGYAGLHYMETCGVSVQSLLDTLRQTVGQSEGQVSVRELESLLARSLEGIKDNHLIFLGHEFHHGPAGHMDAYVSDVLVRSTGRAGEYEVIDSFVDRIPISSVIIDRGGPTRFFKTLSCKGQEHYLVGTLSWSLVDRISIACDDENIEVPVHRIRVADARPSRGPGKCRLDDVDGIPVISAKSFMGSDWQMLEDLRKWGRELREAKAFVLDISNNNGGDSTFPEAFFRSLLGTLDRQFMFAELRSPTMLQAREAMERPKDPYFRVSEWHRRRRLRRYRRHHVKEWIVHKPGPASRRKAGCKCEHVVVVMNSRTVSAAESVIPMARSVPNVVLVGENTAGCNRFGNIIVYCLPNSKIKFQLASSVSLLPGFEEGVGFMPDYWIDSADPVGEVVRWLNNPDTYRFRLSQ